MALFGSTPAQSSSSTTGDTSKDIEIPQGQLPSDSISDLQFSPQNDFLAVGSWDKKVYIYEVNQQGAQGKWLFECQGHVLGLGWSKVRHTLCSKMNAHTNKMNRTARASPPATPPGTSTSSTSARPPHPAKSPRNKPKRTPKPLNACAGSRPAAKTTSRPAAGTRA
jgi:WD40 repeat protein